jgi:N-acetyl-anhydromuramyl-L-alanine amidase AmpD
MIMNGGLPRKPGINIADMVGLALLAASASVSIVIKGNDPLPTPWRDPAKNELVWIQGLHCDIRPADVEVDTIVLHATAGDTLEGCVKWFLNPESKVSAHYNVGRKGGIVQMVSSFNRAWHAGVSKVADGRERVNNFSIGIEIVNLNDGKDPYSEEQYQAVDNLIGMLLRRFPTIKQIVSHEYIAVPKGRKSDPKGYDWTRVKHWESKGIKLYP